MCERSRGIGAVGSGESVSELSSRDAGEWTVIFGVCEMVSSRACPSIGDMGGDAFGDADGEEDGLPSALLMESMTENRRDDSGARVGFGLGGGAEREVK